MSTSTSVLTQLLQKLPPLHTQMYFKSSLTALSHAMEDLVLAGNGPFLVIASFQRERFYRQEAHRYRRIAEKSDQVYVLAAPETEFKNGSDVYETVAFEPTDKLAQEWHLVVIGEHHSCCLVCRERSTPLKDEASTVMDNSRRFEGVWTFDRQVSYSAAEIILQKIFYYRPELSAKLDRARQQYLQLAKVLNLNIEQQARINSPIYNPDPFVQRLVAYLQASQYKLLKANRFLSAKEKKERLLNSVTSAIRHSLNPEEILHTSVQILGEGLGVCRCIVYRCKETDTTALIQHEYLNRDISSIREQVWPLSNNPIFKEVVELRESLAIENTNSDPRTVVLQSLVRRFSILSWLLVPVLYQERLLGMMELHHCGPSTITWKPEDIALVNAIAMQVGVALIQAEAYANLEDLNQQLEALDRTRSNLVAITGHELRTPLSTIQVCLESLAHEPDMSAELRQIMLNTALQDAERMRKLIQDFLTLSQLESGRVQWHPEAVSLTECIELALSHVQARNARSELPPIYNLSPSEVPLVEVDGEWLVEVLTKLLDNACKFTNPEGRVNLEVNHHSPTVLEVTVSDTGRGIEPSSLETVFDRFYQEEGALRRSAGGTGLGLAICRQVVSNWGGQIWAESQGRNCGSKFHFTIPIVNDNPPSPNKEKSRRKKKK